MLTGHDYDVDTGLYSNNNCLFEICPILGGKYKAANPESNDFLLEHLDIG